MGDWYEIGITVGIGVAAGIAFAGVLAGLRFGFATTLLGAVVVGVVAGLLVNGWTGAGGGVVGAVIGAVSAATVVRGAGRRGATLGGTAFLLLGAAVVVGLLALIPVGRLPRGRRAPCRRRAARAPRPREVRRAPLAREVSRTPADPRRHRRSHPVDAGGSDRIRRDARPRRTRRPRCLPARHVGLPLADPGLPLVHRDGRARRRPRDPASRLVRPPGASGSSSTAARSAPCAPRESARTLQDTLVNMNGQHLGARAVTLFESLADAGLRTAAVNFTAYRGRTLAPLLAAVPRRVRGPERFFFYNLFSSDRTGAPLSWRNRPAGSIDAYATAVGRWLVTRDAFDFLVFYLSDYDYASHAHGPDTALEALQRCDDAIGSLAEAAGGIDALLERYAVVVMADHGQTRVREAVSLGEVYAGVDGVLPAGVEPRRARLPAARLPARPAGCRGPARRGAGCGDRALPRRAATPSPGARARSSCSRRPRTAASRCPATRRSSDHPDALARAWAALANPNAGEVLVSAAEGLRVHRPRWRPPRRRRLARLARHRRHRGAAPHDRCRGNGARASSTWRPSSSRISVSPLPAYALGRAA